MLTTEQVNTRLGKFSGSDISKLIPMGKRPMTEEELKIEKENKGKRKTVDDGFSDTGLTYIYQKVTEYLTGQPAKPSFDAASTTWGNDYEKEAKLHFEAATCLSIVDGQTIENDVICGTPDGLLMVIENGEPKPGIGIEIKCPYDSTNHLKNLCLANQAELKEVRTEYYWQMVAYMWLTGCTSWKFCSYDPRFSGEKRMLIMNVALIPEELELLKARVKQAKYIFDNILLTVNGGSY